MKKKIVIKPPEATIDAERAIRDWEAGRVQISYRTSDYIAILVRISLTKFGFVCINAARSAKFVHDEPSLCLAAALSNEGRPVMVTNHLSEI